MEKTRHLRNSTTFLTLIIIRGDRSFGFISSRIQPKSKKKNIVRTLVRPYPADRSYASDILNVSISHPVVFTITYILY